MEGVVLEESFWVGYLDVDDVCGIWGGDEGFGGGVGVATIKIKVIP